MQIGSLRLCNGEAEWNPTRMTVGTCTWLTSLTALPIKSTKSRTVWSSRVEVLPRSDCCALVTSPSGFRTRLECLLVEDRLIEDILNGFYRVTLDQ
jgi:hypothetical protein